MQRKWGYYRFISTSCVWVQCWQRTSPTCERFLFNRERRHSHSYPANSLRRGKRATKILEDTCLRIDGHFDVGLLWKFDDISVPNSLPMARRRFQHLQKRIGRDEELRSNLGQQITNLVAKGYARKLTIEEMNIRHDRVWYLPIFIVRNPNKPSKVRLVWDAAAKCNGTSLNDFLLKGPDQLVHLTTVLCGFRCGKIGICGDIAEMFHQVQVREADRYVQRFLWSAADDLQNRRILAFSKWTLWRSGRLVHHV